MPTRRAFLGRTFGAGAALAGLPGTTFQAQARVAVNDIHSQLNLTHVNRVVAADSEEAIASALHAARREDRAICIAGGRHAMGGQQFAEDAVLLDMRPMNRIVALDRQRGIVEVEAGIQWPELVHGLLALQAGEAQPWTIIQKQTGADRLTLGGALGANIHGRGLALRPFVGDIESFTLLGADGQSRTCSREQNAELFRLAVGGYGLFGVVTRLRLRLMRRTKLERVVRLIDVDELMPAFEQRIAEGFLYGDCQFSTDTPSDTFLKTGVFSCYRPLPPDAAMPSDEKELSEADWQRLYVLSHADTRRAYETYTSYYLSTSGQRYWSDHSQFGLYLDNYHEAVDRHLNAPHKASEMITELYVPRPALGAFLAAARADFRQHGVKVIYGTIRLIQRDDESFLAWAREPWACTVMNLHVDHTPEAIAQAAGNFRRLIERAVALGGSYFLTYHRWASRAQVEACYPQFLDFLRAKRRHDPNERFQSEWYRHYRQMFRR